jgi:hypothetical protein
MAAGHIMDLSALTADLPPFLYAGKVGSLTYALVQAIGADTELTANFFERFVSLFKLEPVGAALARLQNTWFSPNSARILADAAAEGTLSADTILRSIFRNEKGLVYNRIPIKLIAEASEKIFREATTDTPTSLQQEVDSAVAAAFSFQILDQFQTRLYLAAARRSPGEAINTASIINSLLYPSVSFPGNAGPAEASRMLADAAVLVHGSPSFPPFEDRLERDLDNPVFFSAATVSLLQRAYDLQRRIFRNRALGAKGVVAAILTMTPIEAIEAGEDIAEESSPIRARFLEFVNERHAGQTGIIEKWTRALALPPKPMPRLNNDQPWSGKRRDDLDVAKDATAIANVAAGENSSLPMAFGIFGDWGAGKTFFMRLIQEQIAALVPTPRDDGLVPTPPDDGFEHAIVQIQFNAWHYAETNLWASLVGHIFSELDRWMTRGKNPAPEKADELLSRLSTSRQLALEAATDLVQRRKNHNKAGEVLATAENVLVTAQENAARAPVVIWGATLQAVREAIAGDKELGDQLASTRLALGVPELLQDKAQLKGLLSELNEAASAGNSALGALRGTAASRATIILAIVMLILVPVGLVAVKQMLALFPGLGGLKNIGNGFESLGGLLAMASVLARAFTTRIRAITGKFTALRGRIDAAISKATEDEQREVVAAGKSVGAAAAEVEQAKSILRATGDQVAAALRDYADETNGPRIARFVRARASDGGYARHMGLVSTIRRDFEQLESLMLTKNKDEEPKHLEAARLHYAARVDALIAEAGVGETLLTAVEKAGLLQTTERLRDTGMPPTMAFRRIVLYIDDLDRCDAEKVVEILQAVNMLLSFRLFVVIVAVDARWLTRSLEKRYPDFFGAKAGHATAADYLEKIFQIPYWVPKMTIEASQNLVKNLIAEDRTDDSQTLSVGETSAQTQEPNKGALTPPLDLPPPFSPGTGPTPEDEQEEDQPETDQLQIMTALLLTGREIDALTSLSPYLGGSPRRAGRFVNLYRVAKASLSIMERQDLEKSCYRALATQLAIATGAPNAFGSWVAACAVPGARLETIPAQMSWPPGSNDELANLLGAVEWFRGKNKRLRQLDDLRSQVLRAYRFSFVLPRGIGE